MVSEIEADDAGARTRLAKYDAWIRELEARQARLAGEKAFYVRLFVLLAAASPVGYFLHPWIGAASLFTGLIMSLFGFYVVLGRGAEYVRELRLARGAAEELREELRAEGGRGQPEPFSAPGDIP